MRTLTSDKAKKISESIPKDLRQQDMRINEVLPLILISFYEQGRCDAYITCQHLATQAAQNKE